MIDAQNIYIETARFAKQNDYVVEMRINSQVANKIELYNKLTDTTPVSEYPLRLFFEIVKCFSLCERIVVYNDILIFDITRL